MDAAPGAPSSGRNVRPIAASTPSSWKKFVVTNDAHYTQPGDATTHEVLLCVQTATNLADPGRFKFAGSGYYLKSPQ